MCPPDERKSEVDVRVNRWTVAYLERDRNGGDPWQVGSQYIRMLMDR